MEPTRVLVVEDDPINLDALVENLRFDGYETVGVSSGTEAWQAIVGRPETFDVILLDRVMPDMDGIEILRRLQARPAATRASVIMQTSLSSDSDIVEGLRAGAYYYLTKPFTSQALLAIVGAAARDRLGYRKLQLDVQQAAKALACLTHAQFAFRTPEQAFDLATLIAKATPKPERTVGGLSELMLNAIEHGNLGITYAGKSKLLAEDRWKEEVDHRLALPEHASKVARISFERQEGHIQFLIEDEGPGFRWQDYLELSPERAFHLHGRGIAMSRQVWFDHLEYLGSGSRVIARILT